MMRRFLPLAAASSLAFAVVWACTGDDPAVTSAGGYREACRSDGTCTAALVCTQGICLNPGESPGNGTSSSSGTQTSSSSGGTSSGSSSSGASSSGSSSSGSSSSGGADVDSGCNPRIHGKGGIYCKDRTCDGGGEACCEAPAPSGLSSCYATSDSTSCANAGGVYMNCDGPHACADGFSCCAFHATGGTSVVPDSDAGKACHTVLTNVDAVACEVVCNESLQVCDRTDPSSQPCLAGTCTTVEVAVTGRGPFFLDVCLPP